MPRKLEFDREEVMKRAMKTFWQKGYENTSMEDLVKSLGINRFSIYNSFGDKRALYLQSLERYDKEVFRKLRLPLQQEGSGKARLEAYFQNLTKSLQGKSGELGCLVQSTSMSELASDIEVRQLIIGMTRQLLIALQAALSDAIEAGECDPDLDAKLAAQHILATVQGIILMRRGAKDGKSCEAQIGFLNACVQSW